MAAVQRTVPVGSVGRMALSASSASRNITTACRQNSSPALVIANCREVRLSNLSPSSVKPLDAVAQSRFGNAQHPAGSREAAAIEHLHKVEEVVQVKHARPYLHHIGRYYRQLLGGWSSAYVPGVSRSTIAIG
jgi:hypothetical protein